MYALVSRWLVGKKKELTRSTLGLFKTVLGFWAKWWAERCSWIRPRLRLGLGLVWFFGLNKNRVRLVRL